MEKGGREARSAESAGGVEPAPLFVRGVLFIKFSHCSLSYQGFPLERPLENSLTLSRGVLMCDDNTVAN